MKILWCLLPLVSASYDWERLHRADASTLHPIVEEYVQHFPCEECRIHFQDLVENHPFPLHYVRSDKDAEIWTWLTHNLVNKRIGKPWESYGITYQYQ